MNDAERDQVKALLIEMRRYVVFHDVLIGECVAWNKLKQLFGVGENEDADAQWLRAFREKQHDLRGTQ